MLEVEFKASLEGVAPETLEKKREALGFVPAARLEEKDIYFDGNDRDFWETGETLRLRSCTDMNAGKTVTLLTYKGPRLDQISTSRKEYEVEVADRAVLRTILESLGYKPAYKVEKRRREFRLGKATLCMDEVKGLGDFIELEELVPDDGSREAAEERLLALLDGLGLPRSNLLLTSYLAMQIAKTAKILD